MANAQRTVNIISNLVTGYFWENFLHLVEAKRGGTGVSHNEYGSISIQPFTLELRRGERERQI